MSNLLDKLRDLQEASADDRIQTLDSANDEFLQIAVRDLLGKARKTDAERLAAVMKTLDRDEDDFTDLQESIQGISKMLGTKAFHDENATALEQKQSELELQLEVVESVRLQLVHAKAGLAMLTRDAGRVVSRIKDAKKKNSFLFDEDGNPDAAIRPLIESELQHRTDQSKEATKNADQALAIVSRLPE